MRLNRAILCVAMVGSTLLVTPEPSGAVPSTIFGASIRRMSGETFPQSVANRDVEYGNLRIHRVFFSGLPEAWSSQKLNNGRPVNVSFKARPQDVLAGTHDTYLRAWFRAAPTTYPVWWTFYHEPEDQIKNGDFTAQQFRQAWIRIRSISVEPVVTVNHRNLRSALVLMDYTVDKASGRNWRDYYPGGRQVDLISWDIYNFREQDGIPGNEETIAQHQIRRPTLAATQSVGKPYGISEIGYGTATGRPEFLRNLGQWSHSVGARFVCYFDTFGSLGDDRLLDTASQQAWKDVVASSN